MEMEKDATAAEKAMHTQMAADMVKDAKQEFAASDKNSDGKLSFAEFAHGMGQEAAEGLGGFSDLDKDKDGQLSLSEYVTMFDLPTATDDEHKPTDEEKKEHAEHSAQIKVRAQPLRIVTRCAAGAVLLQ